MKIATLVLLAFLAPYGFAETHAPPAGTLSEIDAVYPAAYALYLDIHQHPELSTLEIETAAKIAGRLRQLGYVVTEKVGGTGVVAVMRNGAGPAIMLRTELDALPIEERTSLPYASKVRMKDPSGQEVPVMHACGHDLHMAALFGTAAVMAHSRNSWQGTLVLIGQPAEETISGAKKMLDDGFLSRFPKPDAGVALHVGNELPAGEVGVRSGYLLASADSIRVTIYGKGAHGAKPEASIDPIVIAARTVIALQTIVSREVAPGQAAVVTVGYIHAGTKNNIIPEQAELGLTVRTYEPAIRKRVLASIDRIINAEAEAAGAPRPPSIDHYESTNALFDDPYLVKRLTPVLESALGKDNVASVSPVMASEDYSYFVEAGIPSFFYMLGGPSPQQFADAKATGVPLPSNHSPLFAPDAQPALRTAIVGEVAVLRNLLSGSADSLRRSLGAEPPMAGN